MAALTRERILACAVSMADRDGLDAVTLRKIAGELGVHVTSLYNHVATRDAITDGIVDTLLDEAHLPVTPVAWEEWARSFFAAMSTLATQHPGAFTAFSRRPVQGPRAAASFEVAMAAFSEAGLSTEDAYNAVKSVAYIALMVGAERSMVARGELLETAMEDLPDETFPQFHALEEHDPTTAWAFSLETLVAGLRAQVARQAATR
ncbi:TetR/AcrR family transcriptional regulator C-terminal domain-containing protein [Nocardioides sp. cx-173]|uniref:TetR/AcrR family transcriptional regulator C-terminal domain-containing protein n=1 Tax=Nocardioides sp. cx-173 TaxID=2898796 RepID=UPI001E58CC9C|nr:TetR/AcrR family transcriptional regulator C-terminal domain-containing protein [Nocardioides sp. cx-173]MCD4524859.1 TetR/AcrR family transcriptional regulator C-terminal domain-containing protein [Nocardioides sp. cx-173]UGB43363.1 TetR/AcrR family transcriptional regulator C-terminal domain-containing protein [Nocardioides sp. cx-173]